MQVLMIEVMHIMIDYYDYLGVNFEHPHEWSAKNWRWSGQRPTGLLIQMIFTSQVEMEFIAMWSLLYFFTFVVWL